ncbi:23S rRNA (uracil(1939)-C(5))-methyltransferase RlmD [Spirulina subsalsa FACHB-351]|uniref:23S rRNA (Uracil(1939)-C(5))-methyltransferase RlmD n=1 Tax=Spirulina subsalsa FACHB-351 TaxID=234711 RepID=A0ABT3LC78_9CYAN|nr:23S rRNA (uracil(1939)-C(5))-methyltransferase RlmD [Spirulina subsalsa]MCW6038590.1 23S rRNA (uracil(1939)-C(5))-methyltransferase RlmD [Spirulina subsalsa FACHB-351]
MVEVAVEGWQQGSLLRLEIEDMGDRGEGVGRWQDRVVFVPDTVPGDQVLVRLIQVKRQFAHGKLQEILTPSPHRIRPRCIVADKCGGCQWQHIEDSYQQTLKLNIVRQALLRIGGFSDPPLVPFLPTSAMLGYRNKATYPLARSSQGQVQAGYYRKGSHVLINLNQCPVQDERLNPLLAEIKQDIQAQGWSIYNEERHQGRLRHLALRIGRRTGEMLITLITTNFELKHIGDQSIAWMQRYPNLVGVCVNSNPEQTNRILGSETRCIAGKPYLREEFAGLVFQLGADPFFQINTEAAEALYEQILGELNLGGSEVLVDAYCGIGTFTLPFARHVKQAIGIELQPSAIAQAQTNAALNQIENVQFYTGAVEEVIPHLDVIPDVVILDPPRKGCDRRVLDSLLTYRPSRLVYISCKPATLARDLKILCEGGYHLTKVQPADFFPQTAHVESVAFLTRD